MINIALNDLQLMSCFWLAFSRWSALLLQLPIFVDAGIPGPLKVLLTFAVTFAFNQETSPQILLELQSFTGASQGHAFWVLTIFHTTMGFIIGMIVKNILLVMTGAGSLITQQIGLGSVHYFDPMAAQSVGPFEKLLGQAMVVIIIFSGALTPMFKGALMSFSSLSYVDLSRMSAAPTFYMEHFQTLFKASLILSTPLIFSNFIITVIMGMVARAVPQMNILMVSFAVNISLGLLIFSAMAPELLTVGTEIYFDQLKQWFLFLKT